MSCPSLHQHDLEQQPVEWNKLKNLVAHPDEADNALLQAML